MFKLKFIKKLWLTITKMSYGYNSVLWIQKCVMDKESRILKFCMPLVVLSYDPLQ